MERTLRSIGILAFTALVGSSFVTACGSADNGDGFVSNGAGSGGGHGATTGNGGGANSGNGGGLNLGGGGNTTGNDGGLTDASSCANISATADQIPLAMYLMQDRSGSMDDGVKWPAAQQAITQFVQNPGVNGIKMALQFFPSGGQCTGSGYDTPAVPMGALPGNAPAVVAAFQNTGPNGANTPMEGAIRGLVNYTKIYAGQNPQEKTIAVLVTDGEPNGCTEGTSYLSGICATAFNTDPSILVFVMGMSGANFNTLNAFAAAGGTGTAYDISNGGAQSFLAALQQIAGSVLACEYTMPTTDAGVIDPKKVQVQYTSGSGAVTNLPQVPDASSCGPGGGFYYDNPQNPTKISLCPDSCNVVQADQAGHIDVLLGCAVGPPA